MWFVLSVSVAHKCITQEIINVNERECFFGSYDAFQTAASIAAYAAGCDEDDCNSSCGSFDTSLVECKTIGVLVNYREPCSGYYAEKVHPPPTRPTWFAHPKTGDAKSIRSMWTAGSGTAIKHHPHLSRLGQLYFQSQNASLPRRFNAIARNSLIFSLLRPADGTTTAIPHAVQQLTSIQASLYLATNSKSTQQIFEKVKDAQESLPSLTSSSSKGRFYL